MLVLSDLFPQAPAIAFLHAAIDTRNIKRGDVFFALQGEHVDGHDYLSQALAKGAVAAVVSSRHPDVALPQIVVTNVTTALQQFAAKIRQQFQGIVIALTGSCGKTSTKSMIASILSQVAPTLATDGNLNNELGVPLTLSRLHNSEAKYAVIELGAGKVGDIAELTDWVRPDVALVTNVAAAHLDGFASLDQTAQTKGEIYQSLSSSNLGVAVFNLDEPYVNTWRERKVYPNHLKMPDFNGMSSAECKSKSFPNSGAIAQSFKSDSAQTHYVKTSASSSDLGIEKKSITFSSQIDEVDVCVDDVQLSDHGGSFQLRMGVQSHAVNLPLLGQHQIQNAVAAAAVAYALNIDITDVVAGLETVKAIPGRLQVLHPAPNLVLYDDAYNANPASVKSAIDFLSACSGQRWLVLGDMLALGNQSAVLHQEVGRYARQRGVDDLFVIGDYADDWIDGFGKGESFITQGELLIMVRKRLQEYSGTIHLLVKGSHATHIQQIVQELTRE